MSHSVLTVQDGDNYKCHETFLKSKQVLLLMGFCHERLILFNKS